MISSYSHVCSLALVLGAASSLPGQNLDLDLMRSAANGRVDEMKQLIAKGANVNTRHGSYKMSPLMIAAFRGRKEVVEILLASGADVNLPDGDGAPAMNHAVLGGSVDGSILDKNQAVMDILKAKGGNLVKFEALTVFLWSAGKPWPPKCYKEYGEMEPCGKEMPKSAAKGPDAAKASPTNGASNSTPKFGSVTSGPDFNGTWKLNVAKSKYDKGITPPDARQEVIEHGDKMIKFSSTQSAQGRTLMTELYYTIDGSESKNNIGDIPVSSKVSWNGTVFVVRSELKSAQGTVNSEARWSLSSDGKTLTNEQRILSGKGAKMTMVYEKQ